MPRLWEYQLRQRLLAYYASPFIHWEKERRVISGAKNANRRSSKYWRERRLIIKGPATEDREKENSFLFWKIKMRQVVWYRVAVAHVGESYSIWNNSSEEARQHLLKISGPSRTCPMMLRAWYNADFMQDGKELWETQHTKVQFSNRCKENEMLLYRRSWISSCYWY